MTFAAAGVLATVPAAYASAPAPIVNLNSGLCLQPVATEGSIYANGNQVWQNFCNGSSLQRWTKVLVSGSNSDCRSFIFIPIGRCGFDPVFKPHYVVNQETGQCLDVRNGDSRDGVVIQLWECNGGTSEKWTLPPSDTSAGMFYPFINYRTHKCLDVPAGTLAPSPMQQYTCTSNNGAQLFTVP